MSTPPNLPPPRTCAAAMISAALLLVPLLALSAAAPNPLQLSLRADGSYSLTHASWPALSLTSGATTVRVSGAVLSSADGSLVLSGAPAFAQGADAWGAYNETTLSWAAASAPSAVLMATTFAVYADAPAVAFSAAFPLGVAQTGAAVKDKDGLVATFPSWVPPASGPLGWMQWAGAFINNGLGGPNFGAFTAAGAAKLAGGVASGPLVLFDESAAASLMLSASSQFMATSTAAVGGQLALGPMGSFAELPAGFAYSTVAWAGEGINHAVAAWGDALMRKFGKPHGLSKSDFTNTHLIYNTDHGAYYYYETGAFLNYSQALDAVYDYSVQVGIPYRGVLLDSWWYFKGTGGGVKNWTAMPTIFTGGNDGIRALVERTNWKITAHNRWWSANTDYAKQNGGAYDFFVDTAAEGVMAVPLEQRFWADLLTQSVTEWGLTTYEQDWLYNELQGVEALLTNATLGRQWLLQMGAGAETAGVSIQLCMAFPRHTLQTLEMPTATQIRASDDHVPGRAGGVSPVQWKLGFSSLLAWSVGLAPFKDNYWSSAQQPGSSCGANATEVTPSLHNAASVFSAGPVTPGDGVGMSDVAQILRACTAAGRLLQPSRPMTALDARIVAGAFPGAPGAPAGEVQATYSDVGGVLFDHLLAAQLTAPYAVTPADLAAIRADRALRMSAAQAAAAAAAAAAAPTAVAYALDADSLDPASLVVAAFDAAHPIALAPCGLADFALWHTAPVFAANGWALLGELGKYVPVAEARFADIVADSGALSVAVAGSAGEVVPVTFYNSATAATVTVRCVLPASGSATAAVPAATCA